MNKAKSYVISIILSLGTGLLSSFLTSDNMDIYDSIITPTLSPPSILFPIVWTVLYVLMGISAAIIYNTPTSETDSKAKALSTYGISLIVNFLWSIIFFNLQNYLFAFIWLVLLWILVLKTFLEYSKISKTAAYLQIPYLLWLTFAGYLSLSIWLLNS